MNLLPLQIVLGLQVAAAFVIFIQLMAGEEEGRAVRLRRPTGAKEETSNRSIEDDAR